MTARPMISPKFIAGGKRRRLIDAILELSAEQGYRATSVSDIAARAGVARKTLYDNFDGKEEIFFAALDRTISEALSCTGAACEAAEGDRLDRLEAGLGALLTYVTEHPAAARTWLIEAPSAPPPAPQRYDDSLTRFAELLREGAPPPAKRPATLAETLVGGVAWILTRQIRRGQAGQAGALLPDLAGFIRSPYLQ